uniref:Glutamine amidotransferase like class 1 domain containing 3A n=1 Tax=Cyprinus carpio TaxID=7962 RepID=A0A8C1Z403_CYPCA
MSVTPKKTVSSPPCPSHRLYKNRSLRTMFALRSLSRSVLLRYTAAAQFHATSNCSGAKVAVVLSGCGVYDGTEIHEASAILVHLSRGGAEVQMFAPDVSQMHVIDHGKGQPVENESRNVLSESARIARGSITDLAKLNVSNHDAVIFPGGFAHVDKKNKVVTTPAFMCETKLHLIFDGIGAMVRDVLKLSGK